MMTSTSYLHAHVPRRRLAPSTLYVPAVSRPRQTLNECLSRVAGPVTQAADATEALRVLADATATVCVVDMAGGQAALTTVRLLRARHPDLVIVGITDVSASTIAAEALYAGVSDLLPWPSSDDDVDAALTDLADRVPGAALESFDEDLVVCSAAMRDVWAIIERAARTDASLCLSGEPDTGREALAWAVHRAAGGGDDTFVRVDCGHRPASDIESDLFGAQTDGGPDAAETVSVGSAMARARGGTLLLKNVDGASARVQNRVARLLRDGEACLGGQRVEMGLRVVATLNVPAERAITDGRLRPELVDRFAVLIDVPPLRRRADDVPLIAARHLTRIAEAAGTQPRRFSRAALTLLTALPWPGNLRELEGIVEALAREIKRPVVQLEDVLAKVALDGGGTRTDPGLTLKAARILFERECITAAVLRHHGRMGEAAKALGIQRTNLYRKVRQLKLGKALLAMRR